MRVTTAFNRLLRLPGASVIDVSFALIGLVLAVLAINAVVLLIGAASLCGIFENHAGKGYCAAGDTLRALLLGIPVVTVIVGYAWSLRTSRLTPIAIAALCAVGEGLVALRAGY